jgi:hypothetical protein
MCCLEKRARHHVLPCLLLSCTRGQHVLPQTRALHQVLPCLLKLHVGPTRPALAHQVMLYDDDDGAAITPDTVFEQLEADLQRADVVIWAGISFEQSASTEYFRRVWRVLAEQGRLEAVKQVCGPGALDPACTA